MTHGEEKKNDEKKKIKRIDVPILDIFEEKALKVETGKEYDVVVQPVKFKHSV